MIFYSVLYVSYSRFKKVQFISHIHKTNHLPCARATLYNYVSKNCFSDRAIYLPRMLKMKKRKHKKRTEHQNTYARINSSYQYFLKYIELHPDLTIVEIDTVEGIKGCKVLLTFLFKTSRLMLAFILSKKTQKEVLRVFNMIEYIIRY